MKFSFCLATSLYFAAIFAIWQKEQPWIELSAAKSILRGRHPNSSFSSFLSSKLKLNRPAWHLPSASTVLHNTVATMKIGGASTKQSGTYAGCTRKRQCCSTELHMSTTRRLHAKNTISTYKTSTTHEHDRQLNDEILVADTQQNQKMSAGDK